FSTQLLFAERSFHDPRRLVETLRSGAAGLGRSAAADLSVASALVVAHSERAADSAAPGPVAVVELVVELVVVQLAAVAARDEPAAELAVPAEPAEPAAIAEPAAGVSAVLAAASEPAEPVAEPPAVPAAPAVPGELAGAAASSVAALPAGPAAEQAV